MCITGVSYRRFSLRIKINFAPRLPKLSMGILNKLFRISVENVSCPRCSIRFKPWITVMDKMTPPILHIFGSGFNLLKPTKG